MERILSNVRPPDVLMRKLAIISSYDEGCGNASYSHALKLAFSNQVETEVLALNLNLLQKRGSFIASAADRHINEMAKRLSSFDFVNIQFEAALYGSSPKDIFRHFVTLANASKNLIVTLHRLDTVDAIPNRFKQLISKKYRRKSRQVDYPLLYKKIIEYCKNLSKKKNVWICVHTRREVDYLKSMYLMKNCFDYPIAFLLPAERERILRMADGKRFRNKHKLPQDAKIIGLFGYFGAYKGFETMFKALQHLPSDYMVCIFGGVHPQGIQQNLKVDQYLNSILKVIGGENQNSGDDAVGKTNLSDRVRFIGSIDDPNFFEALMCSDAVVLPYLEVGQSMSGIVALATELKARLYCTNNHSFAETFRYYGKVAEVFDIGNYIELAQKLEHPTVELEAAQESAYASYNVQDLVKTYLKHYGV